MHVAEKEKKAPTKTTPELAVKNKGLYVIKAWTENDSQLIAEI